MTFIVPHCGGGGCVVAGYVCYHVVEHDVVARRAGGCSYNHFFLVCQHAERQLTACGGIELGNERSSAFTGA